MTELYAAFAAPHDDRHIIRHLPGIVHLNVNFQDLVSLHSKRPKRRRAASKVFGTVHFHINKMASSLPVSSGGRTVFTVLGVASALPSIASDNDCLIDA